MRLTKLKIENFRSFVSAQEIRVEPIQALVGENNAGKSNALRALQAFLAAGAAGVALSDFCDAGKNIVIEATFADLTESESRALKQYIVRGNLILQKVFCRQIDDKTGKEKVVSEYHGYIGRPMDFRLDIEAIEERFPKPSWNDMAEEVGIADIARTQSGNITKTSYKKAIDQYLRENDVDYSEPVLGETQALGLHQNLLRHLPEVYLLPAITDYSDEIDRRSSSTVFRRLMADLADRVLQQDPRYSELSDALDKVRSLMNKIGDTSSDRLGALETVETAIRDIVIQVMPAVRGVALEVEIDTTKDMFSKGVGIKIDDGIVTDVIDKGHGLQRSVVFSLLQLLIRNRQQTVLNDEKRSIILAIEEPELYIHPQSQRLIYRVLKNFVTSGEAPASHSQVIYTTHSPAFLDVGDYDRVAVLSKPSSEIGTRVRQCDANVLGNINERDGFKLLTSFSLKHNEVFFSRYCILVEGPEDETAIIAAARKARIFEQLPEEVGVSIVVASNKEETPKFQKILNAFGLAYSVMLEMDGKGPDDKKNMEITRLASQKGNVVAPIAEKLETILGLEKHFKDRYHTVRHCMNPENITEDFVAVVRTLFSIADGKTLNGTVKA